MYRITDSYYIQITKTIRTYYTTKAGTLRVIHNNEGETTTTPIIPDELVLPLGVL